MYFTDRAQAGELLADKLLDYRMTDVAVVALSPGGVLVGERIAARLRAPLSMLVTSRITAPGDESLIIGTMDHSGMFTYNSMISPGEMEEYMSDMRTWFEEEKLRQIYKMTTIVGSDSLSKREDLEGRVVILATDGVKNGMSFDAAMHYLHHIRLKRVVAAIPVGPGSTVERLIHTIDEVQYLYIPESYFTVSHYYTDENTVNPALVVERLDQANRATYMGYRA